jgi:hydroxyacylglutathione hydrolase
MANSDRVRRISNQSFHSNSYICLTANQGDCLLIDPGLDAEGIDLYLEENSLRPIAIFCTHGHFDHVGGVHFFQKKYGIQAFLPRPDVKVANGSNFLLMAFKMKQRITIPTFDRLVEDGTEMSFGLDKIQYLGTPGHTPGSSFITFGDAVFTGDTLYRNAVGLVNLPGENKQQLRESIWKMWNLLPDDYMIYPGHGDFDTFGNIKKNNLALRSFLEDRGAREQMHEA